MNVWLNGTFGVGKTTTANALCEQTDELRLFDPEHVGFLLVANLRDHTFDDFQELTPWRTLVPIVINEVRSFTSTNVVAVQSVLVASYWEGILAGFAKTGERFLHVVLDCEETELVRRIDTDTVEPQARQWRLDHIETYQQAKSWLVEAADIVIDTTERKPTDVSQEILAALAEHR